MKKCLVAFISDHGFGHAARSCTILKKLLAQNIEIAIVSGVPKWFFEDKFIGLPKQWDLLNENIDVGLFQKNALESDLAQTAKELTSFWEKTDQKINRIMAFLKEKQPTLAYLDIPALGVMIADQLKIPTIALGNFSWDWIYQDLITHYATTLSPPDRQTLNRAIKKHRILYAKVNTLLQLPYPGDFQAFKNAKHRHINWIGEHYQSSQNNTLTKLNLQQDKKYILMSFGGHDLPHLALDHWPKESEFAPLMITNQKNAPKAYTRTNQELSEKGITYSDVIKAASVILSKPGYGIVTDCIFNQIPMIHLPRGRFAEYPTLLKALDENLNHHYLSNESLTPQNLIACAKQLLDAPAKPIKIPLNGTEQAVEEILMSL
jgi:L-arabinokinase